MKMNNQTEVSLKIKNSLTGEGKIDKYIEKLTTLKSIMNNMPKNLTLGTDYTKQLQTMNKLLVNLNKNMSSFKRSTTSALGNMSKPINQTAKSLKEISDDTKNLGSKVGGMGKKFEVAFDYAVLRHFLDGLKRVSSTITELTTKSADYLENLNLFGVAFGESRIEAEKLVNKLNEMYGLDESQLTNMVGIFRQLANAMGLAVETSDKLSKLLAYMSIDISSLYNMNIESASSVLQSSLAGQTKPIRGATGADITQQTLQTTLDTIGVDRYIADLSYAEKRLLIVISLTQQLEEATNDFGKTIESPANQMRILNEQWERLSRSVGNVFMPLLAKILPYLNGIVMALTEIISYIAILLGFKLEDYDYLGETADSVLELEENLSGASDSARKLKQGLRGFDKLNVITTPTTPSGGSGRGDVDPDILDAFNEAYDKYLSKITDVEMKATRIRNTLMEWLGFTKQIDEETGDVSFKFEKITSGTVLGALAVGGTIYSGMVAISNFLAKIGLISKGLPSIFALVKGAVVAIAGALGISVGWVVALGVALTALVALVITYWDEIKVLATELWTTVSTFFVDMWNGINENFIQPVTNFFSTIAQFIYDNLIKPVLDFYEPIAESVMTIFTLITTKVGEITVGVGKAIWSIITKIGEIFLKLVEIFIAIGRIFGEYIVSPIFNFFKDVAIWVYDKFLNPFINGIINLATTIYNGFIKPIFDGINWLREKAIEIFTKIGTTVVEFVSGAFKAVINSVLAGIETTINGFITMLNKAIKLINKISPVDISKVEYLSIPRLKTGMDFVPNDFYPAYLDYGERVLTKEENRDYTNGLLGNNTFASKQSPINATFVIQVGDEEVARKVLNNLQDMAKSDGKPITIG